MDQVHCCCVCFRISATSELGQYNFIDSIYSSTALPGESSSSIILGFFLSVLCMYYNVCLSASM